MPKVPWFQMKKCPYCAEEIQDDAKICKWCHSDLTVSPQALTSQTSGKATAGIVLGWIGVATLVILIIVLVVSFYYRSGGNSNSQWCALRALPGVSFLVA
jgi:uncharacterized membrane protein YvbJ